jgi:hypothetical protein
MGGLDLRKHARPRHISSQRDPIPKHQASSAPNTNCRRWLSGNPRNVLCISYSTVIYPRISLHSHFLHSLTVLWLSVFYYCSASKFISGGHGLRCSRSTHDTLQSGILIKNLRHQGAFRCIPRNHQGRYRILFQSLTMRQSTARYVFTLSHTVKGQS